MTDYADDPNRTGRDSLAIAFGVLAIAAGAVGLAYIPAILNPVAVALALAGLITSDYARAFTAAATAFAGLAWFAGMAIAIFAHHPLY